MKGIVGFEELKIPCIIGCCAHEQEEPQELVIDLKVQIDISSCILSDDLNETVDYHAIHLVCKELAQSGRYALMETYAAKVLEETLERFPVSWAWIKVAKPHPFPGAEHSIVELEATP